MKIKNCFASFAWICLSFNVVLSDSVESRVGRGRRALFSEPSGPEEIKRVVRIETFYSADQVTDVDFCTGVLLNETIVLTAAHCIYRSEKERPIGYLVFGNGQMVSGGLYARHPNYKYIQEDDESPNNSAFVCNDIAILFLHRPIKIPFGPHSPRLVVDCGNVYQSGKCTSHGAGITELGKLSQKILSVPLPNIRFSKSRPFDNNACFETRYVDKERLCQGDSGGPVICLASKDKMSVIGVSVQVISRDVSNTTIADTCKYSYGAIITNSVAILDLINMLPRDLKEHVKESVQFENCKFF